MTATRTLALVGASTMVLEILLARQLGTILGSALDGVALAVVVALAGFAIGQILAGATRDRRSLPHIWCRIALVGCIPAIIWIEFLLPEIVEGFSFVATVSGKIIVSLPLLCCSIPLGVAVTSAFRARSSEVMNRSSRGIAAIDLGSALGAILTPLVLLPMSGDAGTICFGLLLLGLASMQPADPGITESEVVRGDRSVSKRATVTAFLVGCIAFSLQLGWVRVLGEVLGSSLLVFGIASGVSLVGASAGALLMPELRQLLGASRYRRFAWSSWLISQGLSLLLICFSPYFYLGLVSWLGESPGVSVAVSKSVLLLAILGVPGFCAGLIVPALLVDHGEVGRLDRGAGILQGANLVGAMVGATVAAFWIIPQFGSLILFIVCGLGTVLAGAPSLLQGSRGGAVSSFLCGALLLSAASQFWDQSLLGAGVFQWSRSEIVAGTALENWRQREILTTAEGRLGTVQIERDRLQNTSYLRVGGRIEGSVAIDPSVASMADLPTELMLGLLPSWVGPAQGRLFIVGLGGGTTVATAVETWTGEIVVSEIEPAVKEVLLSPAGREAFPIEHRALLGRDAPSIVIQDARAMLARDSRLWDAIVIQPSEPWLPWSAPLFSPEFHRLLQRRLAEGGVVVQWLQLYRIGIAEFAGILASFRDALGPVQVWHPPGTGEVILVAGEPGAAAQDPSGAIAAAWQRIGASPVLPTRPWLDDLAVSRWLAQAGGGDLKRLQARLEHRLPLLGESGVDHTRRLLLSLEEARQIAEELPSN